MPRTNASKAFFILLALSVLAFGAPSGESGACAPLDEPSRAGLRASCRERPKYAFSDVSALVRQHLFPKLFQIRQRRIHHFMAGRGDNL